MATDGVTIEAGDGPVAAQRLALLEPVLDELGIRMRKPREQQRDRYGEDRLGVSLLPCALGGQQRPTAIVP
jgi:hypothetical protein